MVDKNGTPLKDGDFIDITCPQALLDVRQAFSGGMLLTQQERDERMHASRREQACRVVFRNQRRAFDFGVAVALEKINEHSS